MPEITELYKILRPTRFKDVKGQDAAVAVLAGHIKAGTVPHTVAFTGPSGVGKTTLGRILASMLDCAEADFLEANCASDFRGIDKIREIQAEMHHFPMGNGTTRVYFLDECHQLSNDAQAGLLKILEDTPSHVYFMLGSTNFDQVIKTVRGRCMVIELKPLSNETIRDILNNACTQINISIPSEVLDQIVDSAEGSGREALVFLDKIRHLKDETQMIESIGTASGKKESIDLARALFNNSSTPNWGDVKGILAKITDDPEKVRTLIMHYMSAIVLKSGNKRASFIIDKFRDQWVYSAKRPMLIQCCFECCK